MQPLKRQESCVVRQRGNRSVLRLPSLSRDRRRPAQLDKRGWGGVGGRFNGTRSPVGSVEPAVDGGGGQYQQWPDGVHPAAAVIGLHRHVGGGGGGRRGSGGFRRVVPSIGHLVETEEQWLSARAPSRRSALGSGTRFKDFLHQVDSPDRLSRFEFKFPVD